MGSRFTELIVDCAEPIRLAQFWAAVLGYEPTGRYQGTVGIVEIAGRAGSGPSLTFIAVPEPKRGKNRLHLDLRPVGCDQRQELERLLALGARPADIGQGDQRWVVLADPEGNEFCLLREPAD